MFWTVVSSSGRWQTNLGYVFRFSQVWGRCGESCGGELGEISQQRHGAVEAEKEVVNCYTRASGYFIVFRNWLSSTDSLLWKKESWEQETSSPPQIKNKHIQKLIFSRTSILPYEKLIFSKTWKLFAFLEALTFSFAGFPPERESEGDEFDHKQEALFSLIPVETKNPQRGE